MSIESLAQAYRKVAAESPLLGYRPDGSFSAAKPVGAALATVARNPRVGRGPAAAAIGTAAVPLLTNLGVIYNNYKDANKPLPGAVTPEELAANRAKIDIARAKPPMPSSVEKPQVDAVVAPVKPQPWAEKNLGVSTGSNVGDAVVGGGAALAGLAAAYHLLKKKQPEE